MCLYAKISRQNQRYIHYHIAYACVELAYIISPLFFLGFGWRDICTSYSVCFGRPVPIGTFVYTSLRRCLAHLFISSHYCWLVWAIAWHTQLPPYNNFDSLYEVFTGDVNHQINIPLCMNVIFPAQRTSLQLPFPSACPRRSGPQFSLPVRSSPCRYPTYRLE